MVWLLGDTKNVKQPKIKFKDSNTKKIWSVQYTKLSVKISTIRGLMSLPRLSLRIFFLSLKLPSLSASQLLPHLSPQLVQGVRQNICSIYELDLIDCNLQSMSYYLPDSLYFDILFYSPENLKNILSFYAF